MTNRKCRICAHPYQLTELTEEHSPPKSIMPFLKLRKETVTNKYLGDNRKRPKFEQNGISFKKSTCKKCNNELLGLLYDPALYDFCCLVKGLLDTKIILPVELFEVAIQPLLIMKSILGHLMSASELPDDTWLDSLARECVLIEAAPIPNDLHIFYWFYPYPDAVTIVRDFAMPKNRNHIAGGFEIFAVLKVFPIAFLVTKADAYDGLFELTKWRSVAAHSVTNILFRVNPIRDLYWPEHGVPVMHGLPEKNSVFAVRA